jgi:hypothetical protein
MMNKKQQKNTFSENEFSKPAKETQQVVQQWEVTSG